MKFEALNASVAWHRALARREASPTVRRLRLVVAAPIDVREMPSGLRAYTKIIVNRSGTGVDASSVVHHEISLPFVSILGRGA